MLSEHTIQLVSEEVHRQYILSFEPKGGEPGTLHAIQVMPKNRPELQVRAALDTGCVEPWGSRSWLQTAFEPAS